MVMFGEQPANEPRPLRTLLVDDHPLFRLGLRIMLERETDLDIVAEAESASDALVIAGRQPLDVALIDIHLPGMDGISLASHLRRLQPTCSVIGLSVVDEPVQIAQLMNAGASGYVFKTQTAEAISDAVHRVRAGLRYLPPTLSRGDLDQLATADPVPLLEHLSLREREVFRRLIEGESNDDIATALFISRRTVETHRQRIMKKLGAHTIADLLHTATRHGLLSH